MKNLIFLPILFFLLENCFITPGFSQKQRTNDLTSYKEQVSNHRYQSENLIPGFTPPISSSKADSTRPNPRDTIKKSLWETLFDLSFWSKLSGPGPFVGAGFDYPVFIYADKFAIYVGTSFSHSIDNTLKYYRTVKYPDSIPPGVPRFYDSCISCQKSKAVKIVSLKIEVQYHLPKSQFDLYVGGGFHSFFGETFTSFSRVSGSFGAAWRVLRYIRIGLMVNAFKRFKPSSFGAVNDSDIKNTIEFVPGAFIKISLY